MNKFANRLKEVLEDKDMKQKELAELIGINEVSISRYLKGTHEPGSEILEKIADALNVSIDYLLGRTDYNTTPIQEYDPDAIDILTMLERPDMHDLKMLFMKTGKLSQEDKEQIARILKATLPQDGDC